MDTFLFKLKFNGSTHFGETGIDLENVSERINSDTLFSALINAYKEMDGLDNVSKFIALFKNNPPFIISSLYLYTRNHFFLPKPLYDNHIGSNLRREFGKELKKLKWLNIDGFIKWQRSEINAKDIEEMIEIQNIYKEAFITDIRPRVTIDRNTEQSTLYHSGYLYFKEEAGLYGFVSFNDNSYIGLFKELLQFLGTLGLGGERTYGCGTFEVIYFEKVSDSFMKILYENQNFYILLSLYHPSKAEISFLKDNALSYDFIRKRGWITSGRYSLPFKRKSLGFFTEGSVFKDRPIGALVDVTPDNLIHVLPHKIYRYGLAFTAPLGG